MKRKKQKSPQFVKAGGLNCIVAKLLGGPYDGSETLSSRGSAWHEGEHYCHVEGNGDQKDVFRHSKSFLLANTPDGEKQIYAERKRVEVWMEESRKAMMAGQIPLPMAVLIPMPPSRIGVHWQMIRAGAE
jgi:hypothetical protein